MLHRLTSRAAAVVTAAIAAVLAALPSGAHAQPAPAAPDEYTDKIKPIFESRCIACHSCYNAPCQLNLQSYSGAARGGIARNVYDAVRLHSVAPTRVDIDASTADQWRNKGFHDVVGGDTGRSLLLRLTELRARHASAQPAKQVAESVQCLADVKDERLADKENWAALGMPYGFPPLSAGEIAALRTWVEHGAPPPASARRPERDLIPETLRAGVAAWEQFLNAPDARQQLVSRYLYEHLFLASLHFAGDQSGKPPPFFRLVRSRKACDEGIDEIATRRPTDDPGTQALFYCLRPVTKMVVEKTHIPYELSPGKLARIRSLFLAGDWSVPAANAYGEEAAKNPFATYAAIPVRARYQYLLDDAQFFVATFIKGPVCNGTSAVDSIQEHFFVFFLSPEADSMVMLPEYARQVESRLVLPGAWGSDVTVLQDLPFLTRIIEHREDYRRLRAASVRKLRPAGYALADIWDGDGINTNALLTVFRHDDNAAVVKGAAGDLPKTAFVLDYPLFERLVYNLVVNFDVFGNVGHQLLTRVYMDMIRMEAEELFLSFLPPPDRKALRKDWYQGGLLTDIKLNIVFPLTNQDQPTAVAFRNKSAHKLEFVQRVLFERLPAAVRGAADPLNWRLIRAPAGAPPLAPLEQSLRRIASVYAKKATPFARYFPELTLLLVERGDGTAETYSIIHNREHANVSWILGDNLRRVPYQDTLTIRKGIFGSYPAMLFVVAESDVEAFARQAARITSDAGYEKLVDKFGIRRTSQRFWPAFDKINALALRNEPIARGHLDLTRYTVEGE